MKHPQNSADEQWEVFVFHVDERPQVKKTSSRFGDRQRLHLLRSEKPDRRFFNDPPTVGVDYHDVSSAVGQVDVERAIDIGDSHIDRDFFALFDCGRNQLIHGVAYPLTLANALVEIAVTDPQNSGVGFPADQEVFCFLLVRDSDIGNALPMVKTVCFQGVIDDGVGMIERWFWRSLSDHIHGMVGLAHSPAGAVFFGIAIQHTPPMAARHRKHDAVSAGRTVLARSVMVEIAG
ncbi:MAG: hypothetical protein ABFC77_05450 [Thermoguttaceae bacterium]